MVKFVKRLKEKKKLQKIKLYKIESGSATLHIALKTKNTSRTQFWNTQVCTLTWGLCGGRSVHHDQRLGRRLGVHHHHHDAVQGERVARLARLQALRRTVGRKERQSLNLSMNIPA